MARIRGTNYTIIREQVQRYNFSRSSGSGGLSVVSFITPTGEENERDADGYADVVVLRSDGVAARVSRLLYYTEDCPQFGTIGVGIACSKCPRGAFCPGSEA